MARFENKQGITDITMEKKIHNFCTIGKDWYTNNIDMYIEPDKLIPDYIEIDEALKELEGKELIIEDVVAAVVEILKEYEPSYIRVVSKVNDATHLPVTVEKSYMKTN